MLVHIFRLETNQTKVYRTIGLTVSGHNRNIRELSGIPF